MNDFLLVRAMLARDIPCFGGRVAVEPSHVVQVCYNIWVSEFVAKTIGMLISTAEETRRLTRGRAVCAVIRGVNRCVGVALSTVAVDCCAFLLSHVGLLQRVAPSAWPSRHDALVLILLYVVHGRIVAVPWIASVDAYEQKLDEIGCNLRRDALVP
jgi:hypothetical protein